MKLRNRIVSLFLTVAILLTLIPVMGASAATGLPDSVYLTQTGKSTCTLCSAAMMIRARLYLSGSSDWSMVTESGIRSKAWIEGTGLRFKFTYSVGSSSVTVGHISTSGITATELKKVLDEHPEGIVLYCGKLPHAVFLTDYDGDTFYCADTIPSCSGQRIPLDESYLGTKYGSQETILKKVTAYWYVKSCTVDGTADELTCACSADFAGNYTCTTSTTPLTIRSGHGTSYSAIGSIPAGATVYVSKASGTGDSDWAHVEYNGVTGYASMKYLKAVATGVADAPSISCWLSDTENGEVFEGFAVGSRYYLCLRLYDSVTGRDWDDVSNGSYTVTYSYYDPNGELIYEKSATADRSATLGYFSYPGDYTVKVTVSGDYRLSESFSFTIEDNPMVLHSSANSIDLTLGYKESTVLYVWTSGYSENPLILSMTTSSGSASAEWGEFGGDDIIPITITANSVGSTTLMLQVRDEFTDEVLDCVEVPITVSKKTYTVSFDACGGTGAPGAQTKTEGESMTLSAVVPVRKGYTFLGWAKKANAAKADYQPGDTYTAEGNVTLYALWEKDPVVITGIEIATLPDKTDYLVGESLDTAGLTLRVLYSDDTEELLTEGFTLAGFDPQTAGTQTVTVSYSGFDASYSVTVSKVGKLKVESAYAMQGDTVTLRVTLSDNPGFADLTLSLSYDKTYLTLVSAEGMTLTEDGKLHFAADDDHTADGTLCLLTFTVAADTPNGAYEIGITCESAENLDGKTRVFTCTAGRLTVSDGKLLGDVNGDGYVDSDDAALILKYDVGLIGEGGLFLTQADVNGDGYADSDDAALILKYDVGLIDKLG